MREHATPGFEIAREVSRIAATPSPVEARAAALLRPLRRLVPYQAAWIGLLDPGRREHTELISQGYDERTRAHATTQECIDQIGLLAMHTDTEAHPTDEPPPLLGGLIPRIAEAVDPLRTLSTLARLVRDAVAGAVLTRSGGPLPLPGLPGHPLLTEGSGPLTAATRQVAEGSVHTSFVWPDPTAPADRPAHMRVTVLAVPGLPPARPLAVVTLSPAGDLRGLTRRELRILGLLAEGWPERRIAAALGLACGPVAEAVAHSMTRLGAPTREVATLRAVRLGCYIPTLPSTEGPVERRPESPCRLTES